MQEDLYSDDMSLKAAATAHIGVLFRRVQHLAALLQHPSLLPVLARSLREDGRWNLDLSVHGLSTFFALSCFSQLHGKLLELRIGALAMDTLELALRRVNHREVREWSCSSQRTPDHERLRLNPSSEGLPIGTMLQTAVLNSFMIEGCRTCTGGAGLPCTCSLPAHCTE